MTLATSDKVKGKPQEEQKEGDASNDEFSDEEFKPDEDQDMASAKQFNKRSAKEASHSIKQIRRENKRPRTIINYGRLKIGEFTRMASKVVPYRTIWDHNVEWADLHAVQTQSSAQASGSNEQWATLGPPDPFFQP